MMFFYEALTTPVFSACIEEEIDEVLEGIPAPVPDARVSRFEDNIIILEVRADGINDIDDLVRNVPGHLNLILPCLDEENLTLTLTGADVEVETEDADGTVNLYNIRLTPTDREVKMIQY